VLVVERGVSPAQRLKKLMDYSQPMSDGRRALVLRLNQSVSSRHFINILAISIYILICKKYCIVKQSPVTVIPNISFPVASILDLFDFLSDLCLLTFPYKFFCFTYALWLSSWSKKEYSTFLHMNNISNDLSQHVRI
jgi:hypothetical protein